MDVELESVDNSNEIDDTTPNLGDVSVDKAATPAETEQEDEQTDSPFEKKKRKKTSKVWDEFKEVLLADGSKKAECIYCKAKLSMNKSGSTTQYKRHSDTCVQRQIALRGQRQLSISTKNVADGVVETWKYDPAKIREVFAHMLLMHELPFAFAEYEGFNLLMKTSNPNWEKISRATARNDCFSAYEIEKKKISAMLKHVNKVSITTDLWKSDQNIQYMVVTAHFVHNFTLQKRILNFVDVPPPHSGIVICDVLKKCLVEWEIESKVWTVTVDNASYNDVAISNLKSDLSLINKFPLDDKFFHVRCCAHILNILVQYGLSEINGVIHNIRESVKYIGKSVSRSHTFGDIAKQLKLPQKKLILDCGTRWNATYMMLSAALEFKDVFPRYKQRDESYNYLPSNEDWEKASVVCVFLEEFSSVTNLISSSEYPTSNLFLPELRYIKKMFDNASNGSDELLKDMARKMKEKFDKYWGHNNLLLCVAAVLDPRNKWILIDFSFRIMYSPLEALDYNEEIRSTLRNLFDEYVELYKEKNSQKEKQVSSKSDTSSCSSSLTSLGKRILRGRSEFESYMDNVDCFELGESELDVYLDDGCVCHKEGIDPPFETLRWWRENSNKYKILSPMACDILAIPITTVASESAFSAGGRIIDPYRASLGTDIVQVLTCGADWIRSLYGIKRKEKDDITDEVVEYQL